MNDSKDRVKSWHRPKFNKQGMTKWHWKCQYSKALKLAKNTDIGAFTYINAKHGVTIEEDVQIGAHCAIYSESTIDDKKGPIFIGRGAKIGTHSTIMPGVTVGKYSLVGAYSFVKSNIPENSIAMGVPAKIVDRVKKNGK